MVKPRVYTLSVGFIVAATLLAGLFNGSAGAIGGVKINPSSKGFCNNFTIPSLGSDGMACFTFYQTASPGKVDIQTALYLNNVSTTRANLTTTLSVDSVLQNGSTTNSYDPGTNTRSSWTTSLAANYGVDTVSMNVSYDGQVVDVLSGR